MTSKSKSWNVLETVLSHLKMPAKKKFNLTIFPCASTVKRILHLCSKHVITMSSRKEKYHQLVFSEVCLEHVQVIYWRSCLTFVLSSRFWF